MKHLWEKANNATGAFTLVQSTYLAFVPTGEKQHLKGCYNQLC